MEIERLDVYNSRSGKIITSLKNLKTSDTISDVKNAIHEVKVSLKPSRLEIRLEQKSRGLKDDENLEKLELKNGDKIYVKDLGPQVSWTAVFITEYSGPLLLYLWIYQRPWLFYEDNASLQPYSLCTKIAAVCWATHYAKRIFETIFVHRFSHATMPIFNLFKNSIYYWGFAAYIAYHINHPLFTPPSEFQMNCALAVFVISELGNLSIHIALRNLRPPGTKTRKIPFPTINPLTFPFKLVSCPNYTYEFGAWVSFAVLTQCLPVALFALAGFGQMAMWALGKHKNYKKEFKNYPKGRKAIIPFIL